MSIQALGKDLETNDMMVRNVYDTTDYPYSKFRDVDSKSF